MNKLTAAWMMVLSSVAFGAGFQLDVAGARATGMGGAVTALVDDASSIYFNPAGIAGHKGIDASVGVTLIIPMISFTHADKTTSTPLAVVPPPNVHLAYGITEDLANFANCILPLIDDRDTFFGARLTALRVAGGTRPSARHELDDVLPRAAAVFRTKLFFQDRQHRPVKLLRLPDTHPMHFEANDIEAGAREDFDHATGPQIREFEVVRFD